jgi:hypothetical protein
MQSPAPVAKKIVGGRSNSSDDSTSNKDVDIIENIDAVNSVTDLVDKKTEAVDDPSDSSATTITEEKESPETDSGSIQKAVEGSQLPSGIDTKAGVSSGNSSSGDTSNSDISRSSSSRSSSSSSSSNSTRSLVTYDSLDSNSGIASKARMSSSMNKSPICNGERDGFEEWHSKWEVL